MSAVQETMSETLDRPGFGADEFNYRPLPVLVPVSMAFVCLSLLALLSELLLVVPLLGIVLAFIAYFQVSRSRGELSGGGLALTSLVLTLLMFTGFGTLHLIAYTTEVPEGYTKINFTTDISQKGFETAGGRLGIHPDVAQLADKPIYLKGYMYPFRETHGLKSFVLCKDAGECCFGGQPKPTDMILINMTDDQMVNYQDKRLVGVAGILRVEPKKLDESGLTPIYQMDCKFFAPAKTWY
jgi:hypothetical protein